MVGELEALRFKNESFDVISLISVLEHTYDPKKLILEAKLILKRKGVIFIETFNDESIVYKIGDMYYRLRSKNITTRLSPTFPSFQAFGFSSKSLTYLLQRNGFKLRKDMDKRRHKSNRENKIEYRILIKNK